MTSPTESPADRFKRLASKRVPRALKQLEGVGKLAASGYEHTPEQAAKVIDALKRAVADIEARFSRRGRKSAAPDFSL